MAKSFVAVVDVKKTSASLERVAATAVYVLVNAFLSVFSFIFFFTFNFLRFFLIRRPHYVVVYCSFLSERSDEKK